MGLLDRLRAWAASNVRPPFERTSCACASCVSYCKTKPGILIPSDIPRIAARLVELKRIEHPDDVGTLLRAAHGIDILENDTQRVSVGPIGPARNRRGRCVFLSADNRCEIHDVSPFGCAYFDAHMDPKEAERRQIWSIQQLRQSDSYAALRRTLPPAEAGKK
jgi:Fe-S-cluster containining protein